MRGNVFEQDSSDGSCIISYELALLNDLAVGDSFTIINPQKEDQVYTVTICGTFLNESSEAYANTVFMSYASLNAMVEDTIANAEEVENGRGGTNPQPFAPQSAAPMCSPMRNDTKNS